MKRRWIQVDEGADGLPDLFDALASMRTPTEVRELMLDLCTPAELEALADRWHVVPYLLRGTPYREIHDQTAVSVTTIGRVARCLTMGEGGYRLAAKRLALGSGESSAARDGVVRREAGKGRQK